MNKHACVECNSRVMPGNILCIKCSKVKNVQEVAEENKIKSHNKIFYERYGFNWDQEKITFQQYSNWFEKTYGKKLLPISYEKTKFSKDYLKKLHEKIKSDVYHCDENKLRYKNANSA